MSNLDVDPAHNALESTTSPIASDLEHGFSRLELSIGRESPLNAAIPAYSEREQLRAIHFLGGALRSRTKLASTSAQALLADDRGLCCDRFRPMSTLAIALIL
jgi:hypothetical protein